MNAAQMGEEFLRHRKATEQFCAVMPDAHYDFKPWDGSLSFGALVMHLAGAANWFLNFVDGQPSSRPDPAPRTPAEIRAYLAQNTQSAVARMEALTDLEQTVDFRGQHVEIWVLLSRLREHEAHHKGQMMQMLRICGVTDNLFYSA